MYLHRTAHPLTRLTTKFRPTVAAKDLPSLLPVPVAAEKKGPVNEECRKTPPPLPHCMSVEWKHFGRKKIKTALPTRRRPLRVTLQSLGAKRDLKADRKRPVAVRRSTLGFGGKVSITLRASGWNSTTLLLFVRF